MLSEECWLKEVLKLVLKFSCMVIESHQLNYGLFPV